MTADARQDRFEKLGEPQGSTADVLSSTPLGSATIPPADQLLDYYPVAAGAPAPPP